MDRITLKGKAADAFVKAAIAATEPPVPVQPVVRAPVSEVEMALNYYRAAIEDRRPDYVPARVRLALPVHCDMALSLAEYYDYWAGAGEHDCESNQWGAVSVKAKNGRMLGLRPKEFEVMAWRPNGEVSHRRDYE